MYRSSHRKENGFAMQCRTPRRPRPRPRRRHPWFAACGLSLVACLGVAASRSFGGPTNSQRFLELVDPKPTHLLDEQPDRPASTKQTAVDTASDSSADDDNVKEHVNPVPVTPQLGAATLTFAGLLVVRYRRNVMKWLTV
jgi:hypothetical protein